VRRAARNKVDIEPIIDTGTGNANDNRKVTVIKTQSLDEDIGSPLGEKKA